MTMPFIDMDEMVRKYTSDLEGKAAYNEHRYAIRLAEELERARAAKGWSLRQMADEMGTSLSQVQRVLAMHGSGTIKLRTMFRALAALGLELREPEVLPDWSSRRHVRKTPYLSPNAARQITMPPGAGANIYFMDSYRRHTQGTWQRATAAASGGDR